MATKIDEEFKFLEQAIERIITTYPDVDQTLLREALLQSSETETALLYVYSLYKKLNAAGDVVVSKVRTIRHRFNPKNQLADPNTLLLNPGDDYYRTAMNYTSALHEEQCEVDPGFLLFVEESTVLALLTHDIETRVFLSTRTDPVDGDSLIEDTILAKKLNRDAFH